MAPKTFIMNILYRNCNILQQNLWKFHVFHVLWVRIFENDMIVGTIFYFLEECTVCECINVCLIDTYDKL